LAKAIEPSYSRERKEREATQKELLPGNQESEVQEGGRRKERTSLEER